MSQHPVYPKAQSTSSNTAGTVKTHLVKTYSNGMQAIMVDNEYRLINSAGLKLASGVTLQAIDNEQAMY